MVGVAGGLSLEAMVKESADRFIRELHTAACDFSGFRSVFFRIIQSSPDPPLDAVWLYAAAAFLENKAAEPADKVAAARDLFHLLSACSAARPGIECVALLAPVVCEVSGLVGEVKGGSFSSKKGRKLAREVEGLVEGILGYIGMCRANKDEKCEGKILCLAELVRLWTGEDGEKEGFAVFFPLVDERLRSVVREEVGVEYLAAIVMLEAFLLKLKLKLGGAGGEKTELYKEIKSWAVGAVTAFRDRFFYDNLLRVLSESSLSRIIPLNCEDEALLREALFNALLLVDYSFLNLGTSCEISDASIKGLAMTRLMVFLEALQLSRSKGDHSKALLYSNAFSRSSLPIDIIKWVLNQTEVPKSRLPVLNSPEGLLKWLYNLEDKRLISLDLSEFRAKFNLNDLKRNGLQESLNLGSIEDGSDFFIIDKKGEENSDLEASDTEEAQKMDSAFLDAAQTMGFGLDKRKKKRKGNKEKKRIKFVKYEIHDSMIDNFFPLNRDVPSGGNEDANSDSDVSMQDMME